MKDKYYMNIFEKVEEAIEEAIDGIPDITTGMKTLLSVRLVKKLQELDEKEEARVKAEIEDCFRKIGEK